MELDVATGRANFVTILPWDEQEMSFVFRYTRKVIGQAGAIVW